MVSWFNIPFFFIFKIISRQLVRFYSRTLSRRGSLWSHFVSWIWFSDLSSSSKEPLNLCSTFLDSFLNSTYSQTALLYLQQMALLRFSYYLMPQCNEKKANDKSLSGFEPTSVISVAPDALPLSYSAAAFHGYYLVVTQAFQLPNRYSAVSCR